MNSREKYQKMLVGPIKRFNQRDDVFRRTDYDPELMKWKERFRDRGGKPEKPGHTQMNYALADASWYLEDHFALGNSGSNLEGLYAWESPDKSFESKQKVALSPEEATRSVKKAAKFFGAALVGACKLNNLWLYSHVVNDVTGEMRELNLPDNYRYAIVMAIEMDFDFIKTSPTGGSSAATGLGYSKMAFTAGLMAQFIRGLGYGSIPSGNDTALSIPLAVEAGLGELGRNGILITEKFGPRVRLCKVFTDLPLIPDTPRFFGVERFCELCKKCAQDCPSKAIPAGEPTTEAITVSNNSGVKKWMINPEKCYRFWAANRTDCANCIRVCPFNQKRGWHHDIVRYLIKSVPLLNPLFLWLHSVLRYDQPASPNEIIG
jgi:reductive dehalogenase